MEMAMRCRVVLVTRKDSRVIIESFREDVHAYHLNKKKRRRWVDEKAQNEETEGAENREAIEVRGRGSDCVVWCV